MTNWCVRPHYNRVHDWQILDNIIIHDYTENEHSIRAFNVLIGTVQYERVSIQNKYEVRSYPITRWMTEQEFNSYKKSNTDIIIW